jgi:hypothetical protein
VGYGACTAPLSGSELLDVPIVCRVTSAIHYPLRGWRAGTISRVPA